MRKKHHLLKFLAVLLVVLLIAGVLLAAAGKAYSLYMSLCKKVDYTNNIVYTLNDNVQDLYWKLNVMLPSYDFDYSWTEQTPPLIAHAFGGINGFTYTNALEAFEYNYAQGHRVFEVDLTFPDSDYTLIACHGADHWYDLSDASADTSYTHENFMASTLNGEYTPMDYRGVIDLMIAHPDIYVITDTKYSDRISVQLQFAQLVKYAQDCDESVLDRLIPQIYHENMLNWVMSIYPFRSVIYTVYQTTSSNQEVLEFCQRSGIGFVTAPEWKIKTPALDLWKSAGLLVATHPINDAEQAQQYYAQGVDLIYTDFILPENIAP